MPKCQMIQSLLKNIKTTIFRYWSSGLTLLVVLYATLWPDPVGAEEMAFFPGIDKLIHAVMMGGLASAVIFDIRRAGHRLDLRTCATVGISVVVFSLFDEIAQKVMCLGRAFEWLDLLADSAGVLLGLILGRPVINRILRKRAR